jgi:co-chaperonin GroES (HSP10)
MSEEGMGGGFKITPKVKGTLRPISNRVIVSNMYFGEQKTASGLILTSDDGDSRGIYPRWGQVHAKGPLNDDSYEVGDWVLVEHGRWTRGIDIDEGDGENTLRMVEAESILLFSSEKPEDVQMAEAF